MLSINFITISTFLSSAAFIIGLFAFFDLIIRFKKPLSIKICFAVLIGSFLLLNFLFWNQSSFKTVIYFSLFINIGIWSSGLCLLSILSMGRVVKWVWAVTLLIFALSIFNYFSLLKIRNELNSNDFFISLVFNDKYKWIVITRLLQRCILIISFFKMTILLKNNRINNNIYNTKLVRWVYTFLFICLFSFLLNVSFSIFKLNNNFTFILLSFTSLLFFLIIIYRPDFLNTQNLRNLNFSKLIQKGELVLNDQNFHIPFFNQFYFLRKDATIENFCTEFKIEEKDSFNDCVINMYDMSFSNLVNKHRVIYFKNLISNPNFKNYSIESLAKEAGFSSRTALYKPFKKFHGGTPIDFINSIIN